MPWDTHSVSCEGYSPMHMLFIVVKNQSSVRYCPPARGVFL